MDSMTSELPRADPDEIVRGKISLRWLFDFHLLHVDIEDEVGERTYCVDFPRREAAFLATRDDGYLFRFAMARVPDRIFGAPS